MRVEVAEIGPDIGVLIVDGEDESIVLVDPRLSRRERMRLLADMLSDEEFAALVPPLTPPLLSAVR